MRIKVFPPKKHIVGNTSKVVSIGIYKVKQPKYKCMFISYKF